MSPLFKKEKEKRECFERIFKMYYNNIVYFAFHYLNDYEAAREVAQDVFMIIWQNMEKLEEISFSYILTIAKNRCLNVIKHGQHRLKYENTVKEKTKRELINVYTLEHSCIDKIAEGEIKGVLNRTLEQLPPKTKEAFILSRFENKSYNEIAEIQQVSRKNIEYRIMCALKHLRHSLADFIAIILGYLGGLWFLY